MGKEKRLMILTSVILSFITAGVLLIVGIICKLNVDFLYNLLSGVDEIVLYTNPDIVANVVLIACVVEAVLIGCGNALLLVSISGKGKHFEQRHSIFVTGSVLVIITGGTSIYSILLFVALFMKERSTDGVIQNPSFIAHEGTQSKTEKDSSNLREEITQLKKMRDEGVITEEEYQKMLTKLI